MNVTFYGRRVFADVIKVMDPEMGEIILDYLQGPKITTGILKRGRQSGV